MKMRFALLIAGLGLTAMTPAAAERQPRDREQDAAFKATQAGRFLSLRTIESRVVPRMRGAEYLGPELDASAGRYRLKFMREGRVIWVDVDARSGHVMGLSGD